MEAKITIAQPYPVIWNWKVSCEREVVAWLRENIVSPYEGFFLHKGSHKVVIHDDFIDSGDLDDVVMWFFSCPRDAMLFKLTWGGK